MNYITKEVTKEFHLELKEAQKLFKEFKTPLNNNIAGLLISPLKLSDLVENKSVTEAKKKEIRDKGVLITHVSPDIKDCAVKPGDIILFTDPNAIQFDKKKSINIQGVFPKKREYVYVILNYFSVLQIIERPEVEINKEKVSKDLK